MHKAIFKILSSLIFFTLLFSACSSLPKSYLEQQQLMPDERANFNKKVFDSAWKKVEIIYYDRTFNGKDWVELGDKYRNEAISAADPDQLYEVINKMLAELESSHLIAIRKARKDITDRSKKDGMIGISINAVQDKLCIMWVMPDSPAAKAGVQRGWLVVGRDGVKFPDLKHADFHTIAGEPVTFDFIDENDHPRSLSIIPVRRIKDKFEEAHELNNGILYVRMAEFESQSVKFLYKKLQEYSTAKGLILDLRSNPGGRISQCKKAIGHFFTGNVEMGNFITRRGSEIDKESKDFFTLNYDKPMVILVSSRSGSAAEIFSHVLQFHHRARVIGQKTAGAVLAAVKLSLPDGGEIMIPGMDYTGLDGKRLEGTGVIPDINVPEATVAEIREGKDRDIETALQILNGELYTGAI
jgi:carboxyl-terminal processing protease